MYSSTTDIIVDLKCKCCNGKGIKYNPKSGQQERCRECNGSGDWGVTDSQPYKPPTFMKHRPHGRLTLLAN
jgi:DnaJ-class molecular chaperone